MHHSVIAGSEVEYLTTNGHTVMLDGDDWEALEPLLSAGVRLQSLRQCGRLIVLLREYATAERPAVTMLLSKVLMGASESQGVEMLNGPLDHRRTAMRLFEEGRRSGWASRLHSAQRVR